MQQNSVLASRLMSWPIITINIVAALAIFGLLVLFFRAFSIAPVLGLILTAVLGLSAISLVALATDTAITIALTKRLRTKALSVYLLVTRLIVVGWLSSYLLLTDYVDAEIQSDNFLRIIASGILLASVVISMYGAYIYNRSYDLTTRRIYWIGFAMVALGILAVQMYYWSLYSGM